MVPLAPEAVIGLWRSTLRTGAVSRPYADRDHQREMRTLEAGAEKADRARAIERQRARSLSEKSLGAVHLHLYRIAACEEQINGDFKLEARRH